MKKFLLAFTTILLFFAAAAQFHPMPVHVEGSLLTITGDTLEINPDQIHYLKIKGKVYEIVVNVEIREAPRKLEWGPISGSSGIFITPNGPSPWYENNRVYFNPDGSLLPQDNNIYQIPDGGRGDSIPDVVFDSFGGGRDDALKKSEKKVTKHTKKKIKKKPAQKVFTLPSQTINF